MVNKEKRIRNSPKYLEKQRIRSNLYYQNNTEKVLQKYKEQQLTLDYRLKRLLKAAKSRSVSKGLEFDLTLENLYDKWKNQNGCCIVSNIPFDLSESQYKSNPNAPSLDRIDNQKGYTKDNTRLVIWQVNLAISEYGLAAFTKLCLEVTNKVKDNNE